MRIDVVSCYRNSLSQIAGHGVAGGRMSAGCCRFTAGIRRDYAEGNYRRVDDRPFGGGPGMVMLIDPLLAVLKAAREADSRPAHTIYMSPQGRPLTQIKARELAGRERLILLCGRYEGVDERLLQPIRERSIAITCSLAATGGTVSSTHRAACAGGERCRTGPQESFEGEGGLLSSPYTSVGTPVGGVPPGLCRNHAEIAAGAGSSRWAGPGCGGPN